MKTLTSVYTELATQLYDALDGIMIDLWNNQLNTDDVPSDLPAIYIEFGPIKWASLPGGMQKGDSVIRFHIAQENFEDSFQGSDYQGGAMVVLDYLDEVHEALSGLSGTKFTELDRVSTEPDHDYTNVVVYVMDYTTTITDYSALKTMTTVAAPTLAIESGVDRPAGLGSPFNI